VAGAKHLGARSPADTILDHQIARVEIGHRPDPDIVADHAGTVEASLDIGLGANKHAIADFECFRMLETGTACNLQSCAATSRDRLPDGFSHQSIDDTVPGRKSTVELNQAGTPIRLPEFFGQPSLVGRVRRPFMTAMDRLHDPGLAGTTN